ncbi:MAG: hypothetical protein JXR77_08540 [Lentisphaeria bacterium]|nr:hypothetical protein [Lentisphaeria bacterium]
MNRPFPRSSRGHGPVLFWLAALSWALGDAPLPSVTPLGSYAVVVSEPTLAAEGWSEVVAVLREKYEAALIVHAPGEVAAATEPLRRLQPRYAAFVVCPEEAGRGFVVAVHRMTRRLDEDPYTDLRWGIVTGYEAADALRLARRREPLIVNSAASSMGPGVFGALPRGFASSETNAGEFWTKEPGGELVKLEVAPDPVRHLVEAFNTRPPDLFQTSGHATEKDWQIGYTVRAGSFRCQDGQLYGLATDGRRYDIVSPHPKVYMPMGNCLIGHIPGRDCMATAWMHSGGVLQMFGYTVVTFHGYMGWGIGSYFGNQYSLAEAFHFNHQALLWDLHRSFPDGADIEFADFDQGAPARLAKEHGIRDRKHLGHLWDRDTVAFYGDPAWEARLPLRDPAWTTSVEREDEAVTILVQVHRDGTWGDRPLAIPLPQRVDGTGRVSCEPALEALATDDFVLLDTMGTQRRAGETLRLRIEGRTRPGRATSATMAAIRAAP